MIADVKIQEVNHGAEANPVNQVSNGAAEYQGKTGCQKFIGRRCFAVEIENQSHGHRRDK